MRFVAPDGVTTRPRTPADRDFFAALYASTRAAELAAVPWSDDAKRAFLRSQFEAQTHHYDRHYADAEFLVLEQDGAAIGRLIVFWGADEVRVVDIALVPAHCGRGLGTAILRAVLAQAGAAVSIHVERFNPALRLYQRLGFQAEEDTGVYYRMRWQPELAPSSSHG